MPSPQPKRMAAFLDQFDRVAVYHGWFLTPGGGLRTLVDGVEMCALQVVAFAKSDDKPGRPVLVPNKDLASVLDLDDATVSAVMHLSDDQRSSRHWNQATRDHLLDQCGLGGE